MIGGRQRWALLLGAFAVALAAEAAVAAEPALPPDSVVLARTAPPSGSVPPPGVAPMASPPVIDMPTSGPLLFAGDRGNFGAAGPFPPVRLISYPKASAPCSPWYFKAEGVGYRRDATDRTFAVRKDRAWTEVYEQIDSISTDHPTFVGYNFTDTIDPVLDSRDLEYNWGGGVRAMIGRRLGDWWGLEVSYLTLNTFSGSEAVSNNQVFVEQQFDAFGAPLLNGYGNPSPGIGYVGSLFSPFTDFGNPAQVGLDYNNRMRIDFTSTMYDIEWNFRRSVVMPAELLQMSLLVGGRYMNIDEGFVYYSESLYPADPTTNNVNVNTGNSMLGVQIGALFEWRVEPWWWIDTEIKGVVFDNYATVDNSGSVVTDVTNGVATNTLFNGSRGRHCTSWALDLDLSLSWQINRWLSGRVGYQALFVEGLALGSENFQNDIDLLTQGPTQLNHEGKIVYHGPHLGISGAW